MDAAYVDSMLRREQVANTLLGAGVAIPHGMVEDRNLIRRTGVAVVQVRNGVDWRDGSGPGWWSRWRPSPTSTSPCSGA